MSEALTPYLDPRQDQGNYLFNFDIWIHGMAKSRQVFSTQARILIYSEQMTGEKSVVIPRWKVRVSEHHTDGEG